MLELFLVPIIKSAKKKLRKDRVRTRINRAKKVHLKEAIKKARVRRTKQSVRDAISLIDKAAKTGLIHKNKAARLKSNLASPLTRTTPLPTKKPSAKRPRKTIKAS